MTNGKQPPTHKTVSAKKLARLPVHKLADEFPMENKENLQRLAESLADGQEMPVLVNNGVVIDGRNRIAAGVIGNLDLEVAYYSGLTESEIEEKIQKLNLNRRDLSVAKRVEMAITFYEQEKAAGRKITYERAATRYGASKRTLHRALARQNPSSQPSSKPRVQKASMGRIPTQFRDMVIALSNLKRLRDTAEGRREIRGFSARIQTLARDILSRPELRSSVERAGDVFD
ncbi:MAG: hypothetical protein ACO1RT_06345 [Planctomycetaceae bacterium]